MLDAARISGRWVSQQVLARLSARSLSEPAPVRRSLVRDFCRAVNWRNAKGQWCLASANVALNRLERQGLVKLPSPGRTGPRASGHKLREDGGCLPALPGRGSVGGLGQRRAPSQSGWGGGFVPVSDSSGD